MKVLILSMLLFQQALAQQLPRELCANRVDGFRFLADGDCTAYIECNHNNAFAMRCSAGLLMDHRVFECLPSQQVNCQGRSETVDENKPMIPIFPDARPESTPNPPTNLRPGGPNQPPVIVERVPEVPRAPIISVPEIIATESPPSMSTCGSKPNDFRFAAKDDCSGYIECFRNAAYIRTCSPGLLFDHKTLKCLNHREVDCQGRAIPVNHNLPLRPVNPEIFPNRPVFPLDKPQVVETPISQPDLWRPPQNIPQIPHPDQFPSHPEMWWPPQQMPVMPPHQMPNWPPMGNHPEMWMPPQQMPVMPPQQMPIWPPMGNLPEMWMPPQNVPHGHFPTFPNWPAVNNQPPHQTPDFWMPPHNVPQQRPVDRPPTSNGQTSQMPAWPQQPSVRPQPNAGGNICAGMIDGAILPNLDQCGSYIECRSRMVVNRECESGKLFDLTLMYCIPNFAVECGTRKDNSVKIEITPPRSPIIGQTPAVINPARPSPGPQRPNSPEQIAQNSICQGRRDGSLIVNSLNCRNYIECQQNIRLDRSCRPGESFDSRTLLCLPSFAVNCGQRLEGNNPIKPVPQIPVFQTPVHPVHFEPSMPVCTPTGVYFVSDEMDCSKYYMCVNGVVVQHSCAQGIYFNPETNQCDFAKNSSCKSNVINPTPNELSPNNVLPNCTGNQIAFHPNIRDCSSYYICIANAPVSMNCPRGFLWNPVISQCDTPANTICATTL